MPTIDPKTLVPIGFVMTLVTILFSVWTSFQSEIEARRALERDVITLKATQWTCRDQEKWLYRFRIQNPTVPVPDIEKECQR